MSQQQKQPSDAHSIAPDSTGASRSSDDASLPVAGAVSTELERLLAKLRQVRSDISALKSAEVSIKDEIAAAMAVFKIGDVIVGDKLKPMKVERLRYSEDFRGRPEISYVGRLILKSGKLGERLVDTQYTYQLGANLRLESAA